MPTDGSTSPTFKYTVTATGPLCITSRDIVANEQGSIVGKPTIVWKGWCLLSTLLLPVRKLLQTSRTTLWEWVLQLLSPLVPPQRLLPSMLLPLLPLQQPLRRPEPQMNNVNASATSTSAMVLQIVFKVSVSSVAQSAVLKVCPPSQYKLIPSPLGN